MSFILGIAFYEFYEFVSRRTAMSFMSFMSLFPSRNYRATLSNEFMSFMSLFPSRKFLSVYEFYEFVSRQNVMSLHPSFTSLYEFRIGVLRLHNDPLCGPVYCLPACDHQPRGEPAVVLPGERPPESMGERPARVTERGPEIVRQAVRDPDFERGHLLDLAIQAGL